jgi:hypothetical protein
MQNISRTWRVPFDIRIKHTENTPKRIYVLNLTKMALATFWAIFVAIFFTKTSGHPAAQTRVQPNCRFLIFINT